jgi:HAD superfamily hydrolase (TIGR01509 family)
MLEAIVFDFDGVLVDSEPLHFRAFQELAGPLGVSLDYSRYLQTYIGFDDRDALRHMLTGRAEPLDETMEQRVAALCQQKQQVFERLLAEGAAALPGAFELARASAGRWPIAIASGATAGEIAQMLQTVGQGEAFDVIVSADDVARSKPDPQSYALAVERLKREKGRPGLTPGACLAIEDTETGLASARAAGLWTLGVTTTREADQLAEADRVVSSLTEVTVDQLQQWFGG